MLILVKTSSLEWILEYQDMTRVRGDGRTSIQFIILRFFFVLKSWALKATVMETSSETDWNNSF